MGKYRTSYGEPWVAQKGDVAPMTLHPDEDSQEFCDATRKALRADPDLVNWLVWGRTKFGTDIVAYTRPRVGRTGHDVIARRIAECVNACAGIDDPAAALAKAKAVMKAIAHCHSAEDVDRVKLDAIRAWCYLEPKEQEPTGWGNV